MKVINKDIMTIKAIVWNMKKLAMIMPSRYSVNLIRYLKEEGCLKEKVKFMIRELPYLSGTSGCV